MPGYPHFRLSLSIGGAMQTLADPMENVVRRADFIMYQAKNHKDAVAVDTQDSRLAAQKDVLGEKPVILLVDDSMMNRMMLAGILGEDYRILEAENGKQCLELLRANAGQTSLVLLDINMPKIDGFGVLEVMKQRNWLQEIPVIITSSEDDESFIQKAYELGVTDYIRRPFNLTVTQRRVSNALTLYARQKHLVHLAEEQVYEHEKTNSAIINILSHIVESRNFESGTHILHVRAITDILLRQLVAATNRCPLSQARIPTRSGSSGPKAAGIDRSRRFLWNGAQNRKEAS